MMRNMILLIFSYKGENCNDLDHFDKNDEI